MEAIKEAIEKAKFNLMSIGQELQGGVKGVRFKELHKEADDLIIALLSLVHKHGYEFGVLNAYEAEHNGANLNIDNAHSELWGNFTDSLK